MTNKKNNRLTEEEKFVLKAAKLKGLAAVEIDALRAHFTGEAPNDYVIRRNPDLFELLEKKKQKKLGIVYDTDKPYIDLDDVMTSRVNQGKYGVLKVVTPDLESYISKPVTFKRSDSKFYDLSIKNELFLPYIAEEFGVPAVKFMHLEALNSEYDMTETHVARNFIGVGEKFVSGKSILTSKKERGPEYHPRLSMAVLLDRVDKFIKKFGKTERLSEEEVHKLRYDIRQGLIKQTFINKLLLNDNESNYNWGLIKREKALRLSPLYGLEDCAGAIDPSEYSIRRVVGKKVCVGGREDIQSIMLAFRKEKWFKAWVKENLESFKIENAFAKAEEDGVTLSDIEKEYYTAVLEKTLSLAQEVVSVDFDPGKINRLSLFKNRPSNIRKDIKKDDSINFEER